jgi:hypothetical protein
MSATRLEAFKGTISSATRQQPWQPRDEKSVRTTDNRSVMYTLNPLIAVSLANAYTCAYETIEHDRKITNTKGFGHQYHS